MSSLESNSLKRDFSRFVVPTILSLLVFSLYSTVDGIFVSKGVGELAMSAVNICLPFTNFLFSIAVIFAVGTSTILANRLGHGDKDSASGLFTQNLVVLTVIGLSITALVFAFLTPFAKLLGGGEGTLEYVKQYLTGLVPFSLCFIVSYNLEVLIKTDGYPRLATITVTTGCLANCVLDYLFIFVLNKGVWGAAVATGISQLLTCLLYFAHFLGPKSTFRLTRFRFDGSIYRRLIPLGIPDGSTELCTGLMLFLFNRVVLALMGNDGIISYTIIGYVNTLVVMTMVGISQGTQPLVSYHRGKGNAWNCRTLLRYGLTTTAVMAAVVFALLFTLARPIVGLFLHDVSPETFDFAVNAFRSYLPCFLLMGFNVVLSGYLIALERPGKAIIIALGRGFVVQSICLLALAAAVGGNAIWFAPLISEAVCLVLAVCFLRQVKGKELV
jgi:putative MATE family efflux protein